MIPQNLVNDKRGFETCLNGGPPKVLLLKVRESMHFNYLCMANVSDSDSDRNNNTSQDNPVPKRIQPRQLPGVYMILCLANNKRYYGESTNVSARLSGHRSRLRRNIHEVTELQYDFNLYGEENFEYNVLYISKNSSREELMAMEIELIGRFNSLCYNKFNKINRKKENNPFYGQAHSQATRNQISASLKEREDRNKGFAVLLFGQPYPSISEASRQTFHSRDTIRRWLKDPNNLSCVAADVSQPVGLEQTASFSEFSGQENDVSFPKSWNSGVAKPVSLFGVTYKSLSQAAAQRQCSRANIQRLLKTDPEKCFIIDNKSDKDEKG